MFNLIKKLFKKKQTEEPEVKRDYFEKKSQKERIKRRRALRKNKSQRRNYRQAAGEWVVPKSPKRRRR